jgi:3-oxoadipate enol-lactonase
MPARPRRRSPLSHLTGTVGALPKAVAHAARLAGADPSPPARLPDGYVVGLPGRGEVFVRDTRGDGPPVVLIHGWTVTADLNWLGCYRALSRAGYRVLAVDLRGHGRGIRSAAPFRLRDCADDIAALLDVLGLGPALVVGYSMGGPVAQLLVRDHPDVVAGAVLCATSTNWKGPQMRVVWSTMTLLRLALGVAPRTTWLVMIEALGGSAERSGWAISELSRGSAVDVAEAGRELGRFDSRSWIGGVSRPIAVVVTTRDPAVPPEKQYELARLAHAEVFEIRAGHDAVISRAGEFADVLQRALRHVAAASDGQAAVVTSSA